MVFCNKFVYYITVMVFCNKFIYYITVMVFCNKFVYYITVMVTVFDQKTLADLYRYICETYIFCGLVFNKGNQPKTERKKKP